MSNILKAFSRLPEAYKNQISSNTSNSNRINQVGDALELFIKNLFGDTFDKETNEAFVIYQEIFSLLGNKNNPPDLILKTIA